MEVAAQARIRRIDILRGIAVFGILVVNVWNFVFIGDLIFGVLPEQSPWWDKATVFLCASLAEFKFYPLFAFLFGAGFILQTDRLRAGPGALAEAKRIYRRRLWWMMSCGLLLGLLLFRGEILTQYALVGFWMLHQAAGKRTSELVRLLKWTTACALGLGLLFALGAILATGMLDKEMPAKLADMTRQSDLFINGSWQQIIVTRALRYLKDWAYGIFMLPQTAALFMLGAVAIRLGWLTRPERYREGWRRVRLIGLLVGLPLNLWIGWIYLRSAAHPLQMSLADSFAGGCLLLAGPLLTAAFVAHLMLFGPKRVIRWSKWMAPVGRMALTNYVTQALLLVLILQGTGLGLAKYLSHAGILGLCFVIMAVQVVWSRRWLVRHQHGPLEAVWRRFTYR